MIYGPIYVRIYVHLLVYWSNKGDYLQKVQYKRTSKERVYFRWSISVRETTLLTRKSIFLRIEISTAHVFTERLLGSQLCKQPAIYFMLLWTC